MMNYNEAPTLFTIGTKLRKEDMAFNLDLIMNKRFIRSLIYPIIRRPNTMYSCCIISRLMLSLEDSHKQFEKKILICIVGTIKYIILYSTNIIFNFIFYTNNNYVRTVYDIKYTLE